MTATLKNFHSATEAFAAAAEISKQVMRRNGVKTSPVAPFVTIHPDESMWLVRVDYLCEHPYLGVMLDTEIVGYLTSLPGIAGAQT